MNMLNNFVQELKRLVAKNQLVLYLAVFLVAFCAYLWVQASPGFQDPDSFYHLKMAKLIAENKGPILNFPWLQFTVLKDYYIDQHFLYHVLAVPFISFLGDFAGFKFYTAILATFFALISYAIFKKFKIAYPEIFVLLLIFSPALLFRISLAKASALSLILLFVGIYFIFSKKYWWLFLLSFVYVWSYGGFILILLMAMLYALADSLHLTLQNIFGEKIRLVIFNFFNNLFSLSNIKLVFASFSGIMLGLVINPYFPKNFLFYWQQLVQIGIINYRNVVNVGGEWFPYNLADLANDSGAVLIFTALAFFLFFIFYKKQKAPSIFFFLAAIIFFALTLKSKRYVEYFIPFSIYFCAFCLSSCLVGVNLGALFKKTREEDKKMARIILATIIYLVIAIPLIMAKDFYQTLQDCSSGISLYRFKGVSEYLLANSRSGEIVMHSSWDDFPMLFYYNDQDYYIVGLDPTFMYKYNSSLYNLYADITMAKKSQNLSAEIKKNFNADYFIVNSGRDLLTRNLILDGNFTKVYEDSDAAIFKLR